ncbi:hypothetical protein ACFL1N_09500 [Thermodesulfobacteriota bacterium]
MYNYIEIPKKYKGKIICKNCFNNECQENKLSGDFFVSLKEIDNFEWSCDECSKMFILPENYKPIIKSTNDADHILPAIIGKDGCKFTWQETFPDKTECIYCGETSRLGFVVYEGLENEFPLSHLHQNVTDEGYWFHDACSVGVYFCVECLEGTVIQNQA